MPESPEDYEALNEQNVPLTPDEVLTFGPCVESVVHTTVWIQEARAPIAVAAGRPRLGRVFDDQGIGNAAIIRPCVSRGRRVRGLPPIYTPQMLEANSSVYDGWPMFTDHVPPELVATMAKHGRSVKELGGQLLKGRWSKDYVHEDDATYGYRKGATVAQVWATPFIRRMVSENAGLLHVSINAWPTSGKPGPVPWLPKMKGMVIEGIRRQPQGSVDYVVRGGAGGRLMLLEGFPEGEPAWPEVGEWAEDDKRFVVSLAESFYATRQMPEVTLPPRPEDLAAWLQENAPHLASAITPAASAGAVAPAPTPPAPAPAAAATGLTEQEARDLFATMIAESSAGQPTVEEFEQSLRESTDQMLAERETLAARSRDALEIIRLAEGVPTTWKADLSERYRLSAESTPAMLLIESEDLTAEDGSTLTEKAVLTKRVQDDLTHVRELLAEARGKPRPTGEGAAKPDTSSSSTRRTEAVPYWRQAFASSGIAESEDDALNIFGAKVEA